ncbi:MAG: hypothetical protein K2K97_00450 [Muribaculaceae bacterium]|nr:hypothetical protein [Muribaculaceae bacterium]
MEGNITYSSAKETGRVFLQLLILVGFVFGISYYINHRPPKNEAQEVVRTDKLPLSVKAANTYPSMTFGSQKQWEKYLASKDKSIDGSLIEGYGSIGSYEVEFHCILAPNGQMVGRYNNKNGVSLDVNGYIDPATDKLYINLGHGNYLSKLTLIPDDSNGLDDQYIYSGVWGRKNVKSTITFSLVNKNE